MLVIGSAEDEGVEVARALGVDVLISTDAPCYQRLNHALCVTRADLAIRADDDDIQPPGRVAAAIRAFAGGAVWSGASSLVSVTTTGVFMRWSGGPDGWCGTSCAYSVAALRAVGGWPVQSIAGMDGIMAGLLRRMPYRDITSDMGGTIISIQHDGGRWERPVMHPGQRARCGEYRVCGMHSLPRGCSDRAPLLRFLGIGGGPGRSYKVGIGIITYARPDLAARWARTLVNLQRQAPPHVEVVPVISSNDSAPPETSPIECVCGDNIGVVQSKNRVLKRLWESGCDHIFLIEDDCHIDDWAWFRSVIRSGLPHYMHGPIEEWRTWQLTDDRHQLPTGQWLRRYRRVRDPQCTPGVITYLRRDAVNRCGGLDGEYLGRGYGHIEYTDRIVRNFPDSFPGQSALWIMESLPPVEYEAGPSRGDWRADGERNRIRYESVCTPCHDTSFLGHVPDVTVSVIIPHCDRLAQLILCLDAIARWPGSNEVIVAHYTAAGVTTEDIQRALDQRKLRGLVADMGKPPFCLSHSRNMGSRIASGDILFFLDADISTEPLTPILVAHRTHAGQVYFPIVRDLTKDGKLGAWRSEGYGIMAIHRDDWDKLGEWDASIRRWGGEDTEFHARSTAAGMRICREIDPTMCHIWHGDGIECREKWIDKTQHTWAGKSTELRRIGNARGKAIADPAG